MCNLHPGSLIAGLRGALGSPLRLDPVGEPGNARTVAARLRFFGDAADPDSGAVRADRAVLSWVGCTTYALALGGSVFLLDAWVPRMTSSGYVPATPQELADLRPAAIFIGHGHFDHAGDAGAIAEASGATVYGTAEHCTAIRAQVSAATFLTVALGDAHTPIGQRHEVTVAGVEITAVRHLHSARTPEDPADEARRFFPRPELGPIRHHHPTLTDLRQTLPRLLDPEGGVLLYQFRVPGFTLTWHDSAGPLTEKAPEVFDVLAGLPSTDVHLGAVQGYNQITNGLRDPRKYVEALSPSVFVPGHHDNWLPGLTASAATYDAPLRTELARLAPGRRPELRTMHDPADYLSPGRLTFTL
ncbi:MBL fold metallo-hydrolase [Nocardia xishanensis]|uniref:MBL fold metallo-hydrolase n=1 Tax=Nocardia xishanensis TaxID=238964 RepID=UPI0033FA564F